MFKIGQNVVFIRDNKLRRGLYYQHVERPGDPYAIVYSDDHSFTVSPQNIAPDDAGCCPAGECFRLKVTEGEPPGAVRGVPSLADVLKALPSGGSVTFTRGIA